MESVRHLLGAATTRLAAAGIGAAPAEAEWLLGHVLGRSRGQLILAPPPTAAQRRAFEALLARRERREPLQHLLGRAAFRHLDLRVGPGVFVPRPETELLVDAVRASLSALPHAVVVDLCAGSGALGLAVADEFEPATVVLVERSADALRWLRRNAAAVGAAVTTDLVVLAADVRDRGLSGPHGGLGRWLGAADVVLSNPPYVARATPVGPEVRHDPPEAVFAGEDGMDLMDPVVILAGRLLRPGGVVAVEHGETQQPAVLDRLAGRDWRAVTGHRDLTGRPRFVTAVRRPAPPSRPGQVGEKRT